VGLVTVCVEELGVATNGTEELEEDAEGETNVPMPAKARKVTIEEETSRIATMSDRALPALGFSKETNLVPNSTFPSE